MSNTTTKYDIVYIYGKDLIKQCNRLPTMLERVCEVVGAMDLELIVQASIVQDLIKEYGLLNKITVIQNTPATEEELKLFHSSSYIEFLKKCNECEEIDLEQYEEESLEYGLGYDCPLLENCYELVKTLAGSSLTAAKLLAADKCNIAINWFGGWHHAQRESVEGFCYVNDIVLAIQKLTEKFNKILYLNLDIHHGNGVQNAFELSSKILTLSFHKYMPGFYPGSGSLEDIGTLKGKNYSVNVPFLEGVSHETYTEVFSQIFPRICNVFKPKVLVIQCGADGLNGDPIGGSNLTLITFEKCIKLILNCNLPTLFLGGGGYNFANTARLWTYLTSIISKQKISEDIPDTTEFFTEYGPTYELQIDKGCQKDYNDRTYINKLVNTVLSYCELIR